MIGSVLRVAHHAPPGAPGRRPNRIVWNVLTMRPISVDQAAFLARPQGVWVVLAPGGPSEPGAGVIWAANQGPTYGAPQPTHRGALEGDIGDGLTLIAQPRPDAFSSLVTTARFDIHDVSGE